MRFWPLLVPRTIWLTAYTVAMLALGYFNIWWITIPAVTVLMVASWAFLTVFE